MAYNTNNPVPSSSPFDLFDNSENFDEGMNSTADTFRGRRGQNLYTWSFFHRMTANALAQINVTIGAAQAAVNSARDAGIEDISESVASVDAAEAAAKVQMEETAAALGDDLNNKHASTYALLEAMPQTRDAVVAVVDADPDENKNGWYYWNKATNAWVFFQNQPFGDSISINRGKAYPLKSATRDGITSVARLSVLNSFLDMKVIGARPGKLYRAEWIGTGTTDLVGGLPRYDLLVTEYVKENYATNSALGATVVIDLADMPSNSIESGKTITRVFRSTRLEGVAVVLTYRPEVLLPTNSSIPMNTPNTLPCWSWIIDENCYIYGKDQPDNSITINARKSFPLKSAARAGVTSAENALFKAGVLDIKAVGVPAGNFVRLAWYGNGTTAFGAPNYGMIFEIAPVSTYGTTGASEGLTAYTDVSFEEIAVSGTIVTRVYRRTSRTGLSISITYDKSVFAPSLGTAVVSNAAGSAGYSWIIDPACCIPLTTESVAPTGPLVYTHTATETLIAWRYSATQDIRVAIGRYGVNLVNDIGAISFKNHGGQPLSLGGTWTAQTPRSTDWIGPYIVNADANGSGSTTQFTGGNHGYTGADGAPTAESVYRKAFVGSRELADGDSGYADRILFQWENLVQGSNTRDVPRYILREQHTLSVRPGSIETTGRATAMEALTVSRYYGLQAYLAGYNDSIHFMNGQQSGRVAWANGLSSGASGAFPDAWAANARGTSGFNLLMWVDRNYGIAKLDKLASSSDMYFTGSTKMYNRMIDESKPLSMQAGESFCWRGGYAMSQNIGTGVDFGATYMDAEKPMVIAAHVTAGAGRIVLPVPDRAGSEVVVKSGAVSFSPRVEADGIAVVATGYAIGSAAI